MTQTYSKALSGDSATPSETELEPPSRTETDGPRPEFGQKLKVFLRRLMGPKSDASLKEVLEEVIEEHEGQSEQPMDPEEKVMLQNMLSFSDIKVDDILIPRSDISAVPHDITLDELKKHFISERHTRIPVYEETMDKVLGFLHVKDMLPMLSGDKPFDLKAVMRELLFVPPSMRVMDLLVRMRGAGSHMAIVVDEYGGTDGLVTMEDVIEEIVGDIHDEHDDDDEHEHVEHVHRLNEKTAEVNGRIPVDVLEKELGVNLTEEDADDEFDTLGGLIFSHLSRIPEKGETIEYSDDLKLEILDADMRRISRVRLHLTQ